MNAWRNPVKASRTAGAFLVAAASAAVFWPVLRNGFVNFDDYEMIVDNPLIRGLDWSHLRGMATSLHMTSFQPLGWLACALVYRFAGLRPEAFHALSLLLHCANALALYAVSLELTRAAAGPRKDLPVWSALATLAWALHPMRAESVAWASDAANLLAPLFCLFSVLAYLRYVVSKHPPDLTTSFLFFAVSGLCRWRALALPLGLLLLDIYPLRRLKSGSVGSLLLEKLPFLAAAAALAAVNAAAKNQIAGLDLWFWLRHPLLGGDALAFYFSKTLWPSGLIPIYEAASLARSEVFPAFALLAAGAGLFAARRRLPEAAGAVLFFAASLVPALGGSQDGAIYAHDSYTYLPAMGLAAGLALAGARLAYGSRSGLAAAGLALTLLAVQSRRQTTFWRDSNSLWEHTLRVDPDSWIAHHNWGAALITESRFDEAAEHFEALLRLHPGDDSSRAALQSMIDHLHSREGLPEAFNDFGAAAFERGELQEAIRYLRQALALEPRLPGARRNLAIALAASGSLSEARKELLEAHSAQSLERLRKTESR